jgi:hypothetical protein
MVADLDNTGMFDAMAEPPTLNFERVSIYTDSEDLGFEGTPLPDMLVSLSEGISKLLEASANEGRPVLSVILEAVTCKDEPGRAQLFAHLLR